MNKQMSAQDVLKFLPVEGQVAPLSAKWPHRTFWPYQCGLVVHDLLLTFGILWLCEWLFGSPFKYVSGPASISILVLFTLLILSFVPTYELYSFHLIFSRKKHRAGLMRAFIWSFIVLGVIGAQYILPVLISVSPVAAIALLGAGGIALFALGYRFNHALPLLFRGLGISMIVVWVLDRLFGGQTYFRHEIAWTIPLAWFLSGCLVWAGRAFTLNTVYGRWLRRNFRRQIAIIGSDNAAQKITSYIINQDAPFWVVGTIGKHCRLEATVAKDSLGDLVELPAIAKQHRVSDFIVTDENIDRRTLISLLDFCLSKGITVWFPPRLLPIIDRKIYINNFCGIPMVRMCSQKWVFWFNRIKYGLDACITLPMFLLLLPLFGVIALAIKLNSKGPVFYKARAIGKNGQEFKMFKFRSMRMNNDASIHKDFVTKLIKGEIGTDENDKKPLKITDDPRITAVGKILRKYSLDELPQLINILMGQMSLIGPRPCLPYEYDVYQDWYKKRAAIRPGITGLWQVAGRSEVAFEEMILLDLYYLYNRSLWMDINVLIETVFVVLGKKGAY